MAQNNKSAPTRASIMIYMMAILFLVNIIAARTTAGSYSSSSYSSPSTSTTTSLASSAATISPVDSGEDGSDLYDTGLGDLFWTIILLGTPCLCLCCGNFCIKFKDDIDF